MSNDPNDYPIIPLPGAEGWTYANGWGSALDDRFPEQDADQFAYACEYNGYGPVKEHQIAGFLMVEQGDNDGPDWVWLVTLDDGETYRYEGGCDYTGWDCQSDLRWERFVA